MAGPVYTGMSLVDLGYTGIPLGEPEDTCMVHWNTTGKSLVETVPNCNATGETLTIAASTGAQVEGL